MHNDTLVQRFEALESDRRGSVEQLWDLVEQFVLPFRGDFYASLNSENEVDWHRRDVYDSTAVFAVQSLAASLQGNLTSPSTKWFDLKFRDDALNENDAAMEWLEDCADRVFEALQDSNFNIEIAEAYTDLCGFGSSVLTEELANETEWEGITFQTIPVREIFFEESFDKGIHILYRRLQLTAVQIVDKFGDDVPLKIKELAEGTAANDKHTVIFAIFPRKDKMENRDKTVAPLERPYGFKYILKEGRETLGEEGGYYEMPAFVSRWRKVAGSRWGHSPSAVAMGDILTLNQLVEGTLEAAGKVVDPAILASEDAVLGDLDLDRGSLNIVTDVQGVIPFESRARFDVSNIEIDKLQESIRKAFYQDQLELKDSPAMTATEVNVRYEMIQRLLGPTLGRLQSDLLDPLIQRTFNILFRAGRLLQIPDGLQISELDIEYTGPLPRSQKMETAQSIDRWMMSIAEKGQIFPDLIDLIDLDQAERMKAQLMGVPAKAIRSAEDVEEIRNARRAQQEQMQKVAMAQQGGEAAQAIGAGAKAMQESGVPVQ